MKLARIAAALQAEVRGTSSDADITGIARLEDAGPADLSLYTGRRSLAAFRTTRAAAVCATTETAADLDRPDVTVVVVRDLRRALRTLLEEVFPVRAPATADPGVSALASVADSATVSPGASVGEYCVVRPGAFIGARTVLGPGCYVGHGTRIGEDCRIGPRVTILDGMRIGDRVVIHAGTVIGADGFGYQSDAQGHHHIPQAGTVDIGDDVDIGANVTIDRATLGRTVIGRGTKIDNLVHIAHNVTIGEHCIIVAQAGLAGSVSVGARAVIAGQAGISDHSVIGGGAVVAAQAGVIGDVPPGTVVSGFPARPHRLTMRIHAMLERMLRQRRSERP